MRAKVRICVIDGQGGGIGAAIIKRVKEVYQEEHEVIALGTNAVATAQMMKARANRGASGENALVCTVPTVDVILGPLSIVLANSMMGELTPRMAEAIASAAGPQTVAAPDPGAGGDRRPDARTSAAPGGKNRQRKIKGVLAPCVKRPRIG